MPMIDTLSRRAFGVMLMASTAAACAPRVPASNVVVPEVPQFVEGYGPLFDAGYTLPGIPEQYLFGVNRRMTGTYLGEAPAGSIDVDPYAKFLYLVNYDGSAIRYPIGVGRAGLAFRGRGVIGQKKQWPGWTPTANMLRREPEVYGPFRRGIPGGLRSPLGARALYLHRNGRDTFYRIHGTNALESIGNSGSAGCIRMFNQDIIDLYDRVELGAVMNVRSEDEALRIDPEFFGRGIELPPKLLDPEDVYGPEALANDRPPDFDAVPPGTEEDFVPIN